MSKIVATFDTVAKTLSVSLDGEEVKNVTDFNSFTFGMNESDDDNPYHMSVVTRDKDKDNDMTTTTIVSASVRDKISAILDPRFKSE